MPRAILMVHSQPSSPDREGDYNDWYDDVHLQDVLSVPGITSAHRYRRTEQPGGHGAAGDQPPYLAIYEIEADDLGAVLAGIQEGVTSGRFTLTDAMGGASQMALFEQITAPVTKAAARS